MKKILVFCLAFMTLSTFAQSSSDDVLRRAEVMPVFQECQDERFADAPYPCTMNQLSTYFQKTIKVENPVGKVTKCVISLVVEKDGSVSDVQMPRGVFVNMDDAAAKSELEESLNAKVLAKAKELRFKSPGYQNGEKARVMIQFSAGLSY